MPETQIDLEGGFDGDKPGKKKVLVTCYMMTHALCCEVCTAHCQLNPTAGSEAFHLLPIRPTASERTQQPPYTARRHRPQPLWTYHSSPTQPTHQPSHLQAGAKSPNKNKVHPGDGSPPRDSSRFQTGTCAHLQSGWPVRGGSAGLEGIALQHTSASNHLAACARPRRHQYEQSPSPPKSPRSPPPT